MENISFDPLYVGRDNCEIESGEGDGVGMYKICSYSHILEDTANKNLPVPLLKSTISPGTNSFTFKCIVFPSRLAVTLLSN